MLFVPLSHYPYGLKTNWKLLKLYNSIKTHGSESQGLQAYAFQDHVATTVSNLNAQQL